jgi:hypothetical protein
VYQRGREATGTLGDREPTDQETSTVSKLFPANSSVADIVNVSVVDGKLVLAHRRRIVKGKDGPTLQGTNTPAFPGGGKPIIGPRVYRIPTKAELTAAGVGGKGAAAVLQDDALLLVHLIPVNTVGEPFIGLRKAA